MDGEREQEERQRRRACSSPSTSSPITNGKISVFMLTVTKYFCSLNHTQKHLGQEMQRSGARVWQTKTDLHLLLARTRVRTAKPNLARADKTIWAFLHIFMEEKEQHSVRAEESREVQRFAVNVHIIVHYSSSGAAPLLLVLPAWGTQEHHYRGREAQL